MSTHLPTTSAAPPVGDVDNGVATVGRRQSGYFWQQSRADIQGLPYQQSVHTFADRSQML
jgi:hypothetical protein